VRIHLQLIHETVVGGDIHQIYLTDEVRAGQHFFNRSGTGKARARHAQASFAVMPRWRPQQGGL
jgi:hypothetical protein